MRNKNLKENRFLRLMVLPFRGIIRTLMPITYVKCQYRYITHHKLNLKNPKRYTEKLQYLRIYVYPKDPLVSSCASRDGLRKYASSLNLDEYLIPCLGVYDKFEDIDFGKLPHSFAMKCTHASGFNKIVFNKEELDKEEARKQFKKWLKTDYGKKTMERHYSSITPRIIIEELLFENDYLPIEYKIHVFNGKALYLYIVTGRGKDIRYTHYLRDGTRFDGAQFNGWKSSDEDIKFPSNFDQMLEVAEKLAAPFPFVRVDLYSINGKIFISEMTFTPAKGTLILDNDQTDFEMGEWLKIEERKK